MTRYHIVTICWCVLAGCSPMQQAPDENPVYPARVLADQVTGREAAMRRVGNPYMQQTGYPSPARYDNRAQLRQVKDWPAEAPLQQPMMPSEPMRQAPVVTNMYNAGPMPEVEVESYRDSMPFKRDYNGPLSLGDPGVSSSLWNSSRVVNELFRDDRAYQPLDTITILISESSEGTKEADTEVKQSSTILNALTKILGFETDIVESNNNIGAEDLAGLINTNSQSDFKGEGDTTRKGTLNGTISGVVVEVLPGGLLRVEGEKIIAVNREEQVMVISGLVRPKDVNSNNEVMSSKIAQLRIDYYGKGVVGEAQNGGWMQRFLRRVWPF